MEGLFRQIGIYSPNGQQYTPQDREQVAYYKEDEKGQILQEGINELGAGASWIAAATSYSSNDLPMIPFYIYYSIVWIPTYLVIFAGKQVTNKLVASWWVVLLVVQH
ncbi:unnamed protein product [Ranitomeya imitator]|uniref:Pyruvate dehydrogenase E1 component middle domain-containing protein n=1 Tax=Ranitomeya imitator TaxID=111125 RepID=A0ABN9MDB9_9NEOB|nr:unnamed protein product [Ranitomeya imitator]